MVKQLTSLDWVKLARSTDKDRPMLSRLNVSEQDPARFIKPLHGDQLIYAATDSQRLHIASISPADAVFGIGNWDVSMPVKVEDGQYPNWRTVVPSTDPTWRLKDQWEEPLEDVLAAAIAANRNHGRAPGGSTNDFYKVWIQLDPEHTLGLMPSYLNDALKGIPDPAICIYDGNSPIKLIGTNDRIAVIMPKRMDPRPNPRWEITRFFERVEK